MENEKLKKLIGNAHIKERIKYLSYGVNEKETAENELWLTIWKVGYINVSWTRKGFQPYPEAWRKYQRRKDKTTNYIDWGLMDIWMDMDRYMEL